MMEQAVFAYRQSLLTRTLVIRGFFLAAVVCYWLYLHQSFTFWGDYAMVLAAGWIVYRFHKILHVWIRPLPKVVISKNGIKDPYFGGVTAPWEAVKGIKAHALKNGYGGSFFVLIDTKKLDGVRLPLWNKGVQSIGGSLNDQHKNTTVFTMTPVIALDATMDEVERALKSHGTEIEIEYV